MKYNRQTFITAFALFSLFFGAGNLILPPFLGYQAGTSWLYVTIGFTLSAVIIPILGVYGHARIQGTLTDFGKKVSPVFALVYSICVYMIAIALPAPRTASVTYEMGIAPYFNWSSLLFSSLYFALVLVFVLNRSKILDLVGKYLTPLIIIMLLFIIGVGLMAPYTLQAGTLESPLTGGILEGYQTFDAIGGVVVGAVIVISVAMQGHYNYTEKRRIIGRAGLLAGSGLFIIYAGLIALGASHTGEIHISSRTELLGFLSTEALGPSGTAVLGCLVGLACFTTAVGIITGSADFVKGITGGSQKAYMLTGIFGCLVGVAVGQFQVGYIIDIAVPALQFIYPVTIVLILLNVLPGRFATPMIFRGVVIVTLLFCIPDFLPFILSESITAPIKEAIPLAVEGLGWLLPALVVFLLLNIFSGRKSPGQQASGAQI